MQYLISKAGNIFKNALLIAFSKSQWKFVGVTLVLLLFLHIFFLIL